MKIELTNEEAIIVIRALQDKADSEYKRGLVKESAATIALADKIFLPCREDQKIQIEPILGALNRYVDMKKEDQTQNEHKPTNT